MNHIAHWNNNNQFLIFRLIHIFLQIHIKLMGVIFELRKYNIFSYSSWVRTVEQIWRTLQHVTLFMPLVSFYTPWKHQKTRDQRFYDVFRGYRKRTVAWHELIHNNGKHWCKGSSARTGLNWTEQLIYVSQTLSCFHYNLQ